MRRLNPENTMSQWMCMPCSHIYDEAVGIPEAGIPPGTRFADLPADWVCPDCGVGKDEFIEIPDFEDAPS